MRADGPTVQGRRQKDELDSYLLCFERYAENSKWEKNTCVIKLSALLTGRAMDVYKPGCLQLRLKEGTLNKALYSPAKTCRTKKPTQSKLHMTQGCQRSGQCYKCQGYGHRQPECLTKVSSGKDQKRSTFVAQSIQKKTHAMVAKS